ncbi:hypothetical protein N9D70_02690 [bacterium]|nr:hypothetical protein [bacterium]
MMTLTHQGYDAGHPWYYLLGGAIPTVKTIQASVIAGDYAGYLAHTISEIDRKAEPQRLSKLDALRAQIVEDLHDDIARYRACTRDLQKWRAKQGGTTAPECNGVHTSISLKHNHIVNDFANLRTLDSLPRQADLFSSL